MTRREEDTWKVIVALVVVCAILTALIMAL